ncbi:MAG: aminoglycoside 6-adenylyltransferase [Lachnospiraceae bacterium]|nr:aminoglycoside 6-adenylyltransferase [Lachnospiraceae bacterium]
MRSEKDIIRNIMEYAESDEDIRAVIRTDLVPVREYLYSYNFCFVVSRIGKYEDDSVFEKTFGERILLFRGDRNYPGMFLNTRVHLMVLREGVTLAVHVMDVQTFLDRYNGEDAHENVWIGDTYQKLIDKDGILPDIDRLEETQTLFGEYPTEEEYLGACHEFWWVVKTFAEYTLREELLSAMFYLNNSVRDVLNRMIRWYIFLREGKPVDLGILDSNMESLLEKEFFCLYKKTYPSADYDSILQSCDSVTEIWHIVGSRVAELCRYEYPRQEEADMREFIQNLINEKDQEQKN